MSLPVVPSTPTDNDCPGCSRRTLLQGLAMAAATVLVGCGTDDGTGTTPPDAPMGNGGCGTNVCIDLKDSANAPLTNVNGSMIVDSGKGKLIVVRTSSSEFVALSDICTHQGCMVAYDSTGKVFNCPCHGSQFTLTGSVMMGPATKPLAKYPTQLDAATNVLTIMLG